MTDLRFALRSLSRVKGLAVTVVLTLALGIGANAAIFSVVRGVLLKPLANRDENSLIYIRQSANGIGAENANFSVPEISDFKAGIRSLSAFGDFSQIPFTMIGLGEPRVVRAGVVGGSYFEVMGLQAGRRPAARRDRRRAESGGRRGADLSFLDDRRSGAIASVIGKTVRLGDRTATHRRRPRAVGAVSGGDRDHRQHRHQPASSVRDDAGWPRAPDDRAVRAAGAWHGARDRRAPSCARFTPPW